MSTTKSSGVFHSIIAGTGSQPPATTPWAPAVGNLATSVTSPPTNIKDFDEVAFQIICGTNDCVGIFVVEGSMDYATQSGNENGQVVNAGTWFDIGVLDSAGLPPTVGSAAISFLLDIVQLAFPWIRLRWAKSSGTAGTFNAFISMKSL